MSKSEEISTSGSGATTGSSSSSESAEDIADLFKARVAALNYDDSAVRHPAAGPHAKSIYSNCRHNTNGSSGKWPYNRNYNPGFPMCLKQTKYRITGRTPLPHELPTGRRSRPVNPSMVIKDVWHDNLYEEFALIRKLIQKYKYVAMVGTYHSLPWQLTLNSYLDFFQDTEFPGVVIWPDEEHRNSGEYQFEVIRTNVDALKLIQLGISFLDENGIPPPGVSTWQFNFRFNLQYVPFEL